MQKLFNKFIPVSSYFKELNKSIYSANLFYIPISSYSKESNKSLTET